MAGVAAHCWVPPALLWGWRCCGRETVRARRLAARRLLAGALFAAEFCCIYQGLMNTTASRFTVFLYTSLFVVALLSPRFVPSERMRRCSGPGWRLPLQRWWWPSAKASCTAPPAASSGRRAGTGGRHAGGLTLVIRASASASRISAEKNPVLPGGRDHAGGARAVAGAGETWYAYSAQAGCRLACRRPWAFASYLTWIDRLLRHHPATQMELVPPFSRRCLRWCWACCCSA